MSCKKCTSEATVTLRRKDSYCCDCFLGIINHKFRSCIGKNKILGVNENVLICLSGGKGSTVLFDLIQYAISLDSHRKIRIKPIFIHIYEDYNALQSVMEQSQIYRLDVHYIHISEYMNLHLQLPQKNEVPNVSDENMSKYSEMLRNNSHTVNQDFVSKIKRSLYIKYAELFNCKLIFTGETTTSLATNLLVNLAIGRGSQVENDVGFIDTRNENTKIIRPMKEIGDEELNYYIMLKSLKPCNKTTKECSSLQSVINNFVKDLQENFQSTISTVCKTADKIGLLDSTNDNCDKCILCESYLQTKNMTISALDATNFSKMVSESTVEASISTEKEAINDEMFPLFNKHLCYGCSRSYSEMNKIKIPNHIGELLNPA